METVTLMHVLEMHYGRRPPVEHQEMYEDMLSSHAEQLRGEGFTVRTHLETGQSARRIVAYAEDEKGLDARCPNCGSQQTTRRHGSVMISMGDASPDAPQGGCCTPGGGCC